MKCCLIVIGLIIGIIVLITMVGCTVKETVWIEATPTVRMATSTPDARVVQVDLLVWLLNEIQVRKEQRAELIFQIEAFQIKIQSLKKELETLRNGQQENP